MIFTAQVIDGELIRADNPINESDAKSLTKIDSDNGLVEVPDKETLILLRKLDNLKDVKGNKLKKKEMLF